ncbi:hypothetical protein [Longimicrobium sp.]|uniref:hypothetical protein n=1 Tax=Longimicrobium sp. TaxID=2029185 RepID=UPI002B8959A4|nr:hypothetical protein [Longimicrobium sp.]HSU14793.1 hypothetical protein [Longimicrobium sp.]
MRATLRPESVADPITTPHRYREVRPGIDGFRLVSATLTVTLLPEPNRARYEYECHLETLGGVPARYWCYHLPADADELADLRAWDARGKLSARFLAAEAPGTRIEVRLRQPVRTGERYTFTFGYEAVIESVVAAEGRVRTVTYADWIIFNIPCALLHVHVDLPPGAAFVAAVPRCVVSAAGRVTWRVRALRPLEMVAMTVAYRAEARERRRLFWQLSRMWRGAGDGDRDER